MHRANSVHVLNGRQGIEETDGEAGVWLSIRRSLTALRRGSQDGDPNPQGSARSLRAALATSHWTSWKEQELALRCYLPFPLLLPPLSRWEKTHGKPGYSDGAPQEHPGEMPQSDKSAVQPQPARRPPEGGSSLSRLWRTARTQCSEHRNPGPAKDPGRKGGRRGCDPEGAQCPQPDVCDGTGADPTRKQQGGGDRTPSPSPPPRSLDEEAPRRLRRQLHPNGKTKRWKQVPRQPLLARKEDVTCRPGHLSSLGSTSLTFLFKCEVPCKALASS